MPISFFQIFDFLYSKGTPNYNPFELRPPLSNGKSLYVADHLGWYDLAPDFSGESRYGKNYFYVKTDKNGFRINHLVDNGESKKSFFGEKIFFIETHLLWSRLRLGKKFVGILNKVFNINAINAGVNSYSPTTYKYKLKSMITQSFISKNQKIVIGLDISDVFDEATRWTDYQGKPAIIQEVNRLNKKKLSKNLLTNDSSFKNKNKNKNLENFYTKENFKITYQIYFGIESFVKSFIDDIQVRNNDRSKLTHQDWELINDKFLPLGIERPKIKIIYRFSIFI